MSTESDDESLKSEDASRNFNGADGTFNAMKPSSILHPSLVLRNKEEIPNLDAPGFEEELPGWHGYIEWEKYPKGTHEKFNFPGV
jgi:hypothetical protein